MKAPEGTAGEMAPAPAADPAAAAGPAGAAPAGPGMAQAYLGGFGGRAASAAALAWYASLDTVAAVSPSVAASVVRELRDQRANIKLIASENLSSPAVQLAQ
ncbi:MAG: hypothetical protein ACYDH5_15255, partial [Acidimicrobiales bacterium]